MNLHQEIFPEANVDKYHFKDELVSSAPYLVKRSDIETWATDLKVLGDVSRRLAIGKADEYYQVRSDYQEVIEVYTGEQRQPMVMRPDAIINNGQMKILELNIDSGIGGFWEVEKLQSYFMAQDSSDPDAWSSPRRAWIQFFSDFLPADETQITIGIVGSQYLEDSNRKKVQSCAKWLEDIPGIHVKYIQPEDLREKDGWMSDGERTFHVLYRYRSLLHSPQQVKEMTDAMLLSKSTKTIFLSDPIDLLIEQKGVLALMSTLAECDDDQYLNSEEHALIKKYIPWTRLYGDEHFEREGLQYPRLGFMVQFKDQLVLKRMHSHHGDHVFIGCEKTDEEWNACLAQAEKSPSEWIVQERIESDLFNFSYHEEGGEKEKQKAFIFSPYFFGPHFGGALIRVQQNLRHQILSLPTMSPMGFAAVKEIS